MLINSLVGIFLFGTAALTVMILAMANAIISMKNAKLVELNQHDAQSALSLALSKGLISPEWEADSGFFPEGAFRVLGLNTLIIFVSIWFRARLRPLNLSPFGKTESFQPVPTVTDTRCPNENFAGSRLSTKKTPADFGTITRKQSLTFHQCIQNSGPNALT